ncbi:hypothetical protein NKG05_26910 [Oerskovia sp. M15]
MVIGAVVLVVYGYLRPQVGTADARSASTLVLIGVSLWIVGIQARPLNGWKVALIATMAGAPCWPSRSRGSATSSRSRSRRRRRPGSSRSPWSRAGSRSRSCTGSWCPGSSAADVREYLDVKINAVCCVSAAFRCVARPGVRWAKPPEPS